MSPNKTPDETARFRTSRTTHQYAPWWSMHTLLSECDNDLGEYRRRGGGKQFFEGDCIPAGGLKLKPPSLKCCCLRGESVGDTVAIHSTFRRLGYHGVLLEEAQELPEGGCTREIRRNRCPIGRSRRFSSTEIVEALGTKYRAQPKGH